jgi:hypothetical protein
MSYSWRSAEDNSPSIALRCFTCLEGLLAQVCKVEHLPANRRQLRCLRRSNHLEIGQGVIEREQQRHCIVFEPNQNIRSRSRSRVLQFAEGSAFSRHTLKFPYQHAVGYSENPLPA